METRRKTLALALLAATQFVLVLDASIINVALPSIGRDLDVEVDELSWVVNAYILMFGGFLLLGGRLADYAGRRRMFTAGLALFSAASLAGALATSAEWLIGARALQGLGAALVSPAALALLMTIFGEGAERNRALGVWAALGGSGGAAGAILGGVLTDGLGWQAVLAVNVPIGLIAVALAPRLLPESRLEGTRGFDVAGAVSVTVGLAVLVYAIVDAEHAGWTSAQTLGLAALAVAMLLSFVVIESRAARPLVPLGIFRNRELRGGNLVTIANTGALFPMFFFLTLYTQKVLGYSAVESGLAQLPIAVTIAASATVAPRLVAHVGAKAALVAGLALASVGLAWFAALPADGTFLANVLGPSLVVGVGEGVVWVASMVAATSGATTEESGLASGLVNTSQQIGGALGVAVLVAVANRADVFTDGLSAGFTVAALIAGAGMLAAARLLPGRRQDHGPYLARQRGARLVTGDDAPTPTPATGS